MTIFFYKGLSRNPKIGNTLLWVLLNIFRLGQVKHTKFGTNISNKILLNTSISLFVFAYSKITLVSWKTGKEKESVQSEHGCRKSLGFNTFIEKGLKLCLPLIYKKNVGLRKLFKILKVIFSDIRYYLKFYIETF